MKRFATLLVITAMLLSLVLTGCTPKEPVSDGGDKEKILVVRTNSDPISLMPNTAANDSAWPMVQNIYNRLVKLDANTQVLPDLAREWESSPDGKSITFYLTEDAKWHDGEPVTSKDVKYTFDHIRENSVCFANNSLANVESIETPDDYTVVFHFSKPDSAVVGFLAWYATFVLPEHLFNNGQTWDDNEHAKNPIGSGPFKFEKQTPGVNVTLVKNEDYWDGAPIIDKLVFQIIPDDATAVQALLNGEVDAMSLPATEVQKFENDDNFTLVAYELPSPTYVVFSFDKDKGVPYPVRKALALCVDRDSISEKVFAGIRLPEYNYYPSNMGWASNSDAPAPSYNIEEAMAVLEEAGYKKDADGYYVRDLQLDTFGEANVDVAKLIAAECEKAGIELVVNSFESQAWSAKVTGDRDFSVAILGGFQGPDVAALGSRISTTGQMNHGNYSNLKVDELFKEGLTSVDQDVRQPLYHEAQRLMSEDIPIIPIVGFRGYQVQASNIKKTPWQNAGVAGWGEYTITDIE